MRVISAGMSEPLKHELESWSRRVVHATQRLEDLKRVSASGEHLVVVSAAASRESARGAPRAVATRPPESGSWQAGRRPAGSGATAAMPPIDVVALTDQVMHRIDRRLVAWRERTGRL